MLEKKLCFSLYFLKWYVLHCYSVEEIVIIWHISSKRFGEIIRNACTYVPYSCTVMWWCVHYILECFPEMLWCSFHWCLPAADGWKVLVFHTCCFQRGRSCTSIPQHLLSLLPFPPLLRFDSMAASSTVDFHCLRLFYLVFSRFPI